MIRVIVLRIDDQHIASSEVDILYDGDDLDLALKIGNREMDSCLMNGMRIVRITGWEYGREMVVLNKGHKFQKIIVEDYE